MFIPPNFIPEYRPARKFSVFSSNGWWLNQWPVLGWVETFVKIAAWTFVPSLDTHKSAAFPTTPVFALQTFLMFFASFGLALAIIDRMVYRELISIIFVFPNNWAHWTVTLAMYRHGPSPSNLRYIRIFCWLMLAGDVVKLLFFSVHDFTRLKIARYVVYTLVLIYALIYALILLLDTTYISTSSPFFLRVYDTVVNPLYSQLRPIFNSQ